MARKSKGWKAKGRKNPGWFRPGFDARRHIFTREERELGGAVFSWCYAFVPAGTQWGRDLTFFARLQVVNGYKKTK